MKMSDKVSANPTSEISISSNNLLLGNSDGSQDLLVILSKHHVDQVGQCGPQFNQSACQIATDQRPELPKN